MAGLFSARLQITGSIGICALHPLQDIHRDRNHCSWQALKIPRRPRACINQNVGFTSVGYLQLIVRNNSCAQASHLNSLHYAFHSLSMAFPKLLLVGCSVSATSSSSSPRYGVSRFFDCNQRMLRARIVAVAAESLADGPVLMPVGTSGRIVTGVRAVSFGFYIDPTSPHLTPWDKMQAI